MISSSSCILNIIQVMRGRGGEGRLDYLSIQFTIFRQRVEEEKTDWIIYLYSLQYIGKE